MGLASWTDYVQTSFGYGHAELPLSIPIAFYYQLTLWQHHLLFSIRDPMKSSSPLSSKNWERAKLPLPPQFWLGGVADYIQYQWNQRWNNRCAGNEYLSTCNGKANTFRNFQHLEASAERKTFTFAGLSLNYVHSTMLTSSDVNGKDHDVGPVSDRVLKKSKV